MTELEREQLSARLKKAANYAKQEYDFLYRVMKLELADAESAYQRYTILADAATDVYDFDFDKGE